MNHYTQQLYSKSQEVKQMVKGKLSEGGEQVKETLNSVSQNVADIKNEGK